VGTDSYGQVRALSWRVYWAIPDIYITTKGNRSTKNYKTKQKTDLKFIYKERLGKSVNMFICQLNRKIGEYVHLPTDPSAVRGANWAKNNKKREKAKARIVKFADDNPSLCLLSLLIVFCPVSTANCRWIPLYMLFVDRFSPFPITVTVITLNKRYD
jgi:hypothetical protein